MKKCNAIECADDCRVCVHVCMCMCVFSFYVCDQHHVCAVHACRHKTKHTCTYECRLINSIQCYVLHSTQYKNWRKRFFRLHSDGMLTYYKSDKSGASLLGEMEIDTIRLLRSGWETDWSKLGAGCPMEATPDTRIELVSDTRTLRFYCASKEDAKQWTKVLTDQMESYKLHRKPTKFTGASLQVCVHVRMCVCVCVCACVGVGVSVSVGGSFENACFFR